MQSEGSSHLPNVSTVEGTWRWQAVVTRACCAHLEPSLQAGGILLLKALLQAIAPQGRQGCCSPVHKGCGGHLCKAVVCPQEVVSPLEAVLFQELIQGLQSI